jgi:short-subunit dehydrogenase
MTLITGASAALGRAFAEALSVGTGLVLAARAQARAYGLKAELAQP